MALEAKRVTTPEELKIAKALRWQVFIVEQGFDGKDELDEFDAKDTTYHFIGKDVELDKYVAVARVLMYAAEKKATIGRVAVLAECRGKNYGAAFMTAVEQAVADEVDVFTLSAQYDKKGFYERCGYACVSDETFVDRNVLQCWMVKTIAKWTREYTSRIF